MVNGAYPAMLTQGEATQGPIYGRGFPHHALLTSGKLFVNVQDERVGTLLCSELLCAGL